MTDLVFVNTSKQVGDADHIKMLTNHDAAETCFEENVVYGPAGSATETAYRNICSEPGTTVPPLGPVATDRKVP